MVNVTKPEVQLVRPAVADFLEEGQSAHWGEYVYRLKGIKLSNNRD